MRAMTAYGQQFGVGGGTTAWLHTFLTSALDGGERSVGQPKCCTVEKMNCAEHKTEPFWTVSTEQKSDTNTNSWNMSPQLHSP